ISITDLGRRFLTAGTDDPDGLASRREATLKPRVIREFLQKYNGAKMPREDVALKILEGLGVPHDALKRAFELITEAAKTADFFKEINGVQYIDLEQTPVGPAPTAESGEEQRDHQNDHSRHAVAPPPPDLESAGAVPNPTLPDLRAR